VTDGSGNSDTCTSTVTVEDNTAPTIGTPATNITQDTDAGTCEAVVDVTPPVFADNCCADTYNTVIDVDGTGEHVLVPDVIPNGAFSIEFWFRPMSSTWNGVLYDMTDDPIYLTIRGTETSLYWGFESANDGDAQQNVTGLSLGDQAWHHIVVTGVFNQQGPNEIYLDGTLIGTNTPVNVIDGKGSLNPGRIGADTDDGYQTNAMDH
ncbi:MAG: LamG-like jellyroll fold domain-containing protein, partial [Bacteroidota bacterium]